MSQEAFENGAGLGIEKKNEKRSEAPKVVKKNAGEMAINRSAANDEIYEEDTMAAGQSGEIGGLRWKRTYLEMKATCSNSGCGNLLGSQYGVVEEGKESGPYYCTPECLREAKGSSF